MTIRSSDVPILAAVRTPIEPVPTTVGYRLATALVACLMVLLPVIYLALIGAIGYGVYWHLTTHTGILEANVRGKAKMFAVFLYLAPAIVGAILVAFMFKPLFARRPKGPKPRTLRREDEPLLFEFVDGLCASVGSPRPKSILLDSDVNAAAALTSSVLNPFRYDLMLIIGLPLVAGMSLRQLAGVLAHEFGHFSQGTAMRLGGVIHRINRWFAFVVYQRDSWDEQLEVWSKEWDLRISWVLWIARAMIWVTRKILFALMWVGTAMSCRLSREQEFDADRHETRFSGSSEFANTFGRLGELSVGRSRAIGDLQSSFRERRLVDDFFELAQHHADSMTPDERHSMRESRLAEKTGRFDTHPSDADRIASAELEDAPGVFQFDVPASVLFRDFAATCRTETLNFYQEQVGDEIAASQLVPTQDILARRKALQQQDEATERVLADLYAYQWVLPFPVELQPATEPLERTLAKIRALRDRVPGHAAAHAAAIQLIRIEQTFEQEANLAELLLRGNITVDKTVFRVPLTNLKEVAAVRQQIAVAKVEAYQPLAEMLRDFADRLLLPLGLLGNPEVAAKIPDADNLWDESRQLIQQVLELQQHHDSLLRVMDARELIQDMSQQLNGQEQNEVFLACYRRTGQEGVKLLKELYPSLAAAAYPFEHAEGQVSLARYLLPEIPAADNLGAVHSVLTHVMMEGLRLTTRIVSRLCVIVEQVETALGLPPGEKPAPATTEG